MENQSAAIKDGKILYTLSTIRDIIDVSNKLNKNVSVISLDFLKAFDRVGWDFIFSTLQKIFQISSVTLEIVQINSFI